MKYSQAIILAAAASAAVVSAAPTTAPASVPKASSTAVARPPTEAKPAVSGGQTTTPVATPKGKGHHNKSNKNHKHSQSKSKGSKASKPKSKESKESKPQASQVTQPTTPVATREFLDEIEELDARGFGTRIGGTIRQAAHAVRTGMKGHKADTVLGLGGIAATVGTALHSSKKDQQKRDLDEQEILDLFERSFDEVEELDARALGAAIRRAGSAIRKGMKGHKVDTALGVANIATTVATANAGKRDLEDDELLELFERNLDEMEELDARAIGAAIRKFGTAIRNRMKGHKMDTALAAGGIAATVGTAMAPQNKRDFDEHNVLDLFERDLSEEFDEIDARALGASIRRIGTSIRNRMKGHKMDTALAAGGIAATVGTAMAPQNKRDFDEHDILDLFERDIEEFDEIDARGVRGLIRKAGGAIRNGVKKNGANIAMTGVGIAGTVAASQGQPQQRDFDELESVEARDLSDDELLELLERSLDEIDARAIGGLIRKAGGLVRKGASAIRKGLKDNKADLAITGAGIAGSMAASKGQPQQRDLGDFNELEIRDFDFDLNELD